MKKIHAVIVSFNPELTQLNNVVNSIIHQVDHLWIIDNFSNLPIESWITKFNFKDKLNFFIMPKNLGLGAALNFGIKKALSSDAGLILLLDQDSCPLPDMVSHLLTSFMRLSSSGENIALVAPSYSYSHNDQFSKFITFGWLGHSKQSPKKNEDTIPADFAISSGSLINANTFNKIGFFDDNLFIDHLDTDWCMRATYEGFKIYGVPNARMIHSIGINHKKYWFLRWRNISFHHPYRYYFIIRNGLLLQRKIYSPIKWRICELFRIFRTIIFYSLIGNQRLKRIYWIFWGFVDGIRCTNGPLVKK